MLQIYDDQHRRIAGIDDPDDLKIEKTLSSGDKQISFSYPKTGSEIENLRAEYYIRTKDDEYVLKEISTGENKNSYVAQLNIEELESQEFLYGFESVTQTAHACLEFAFDGTGWTVGICTVTKRRTVSIDETCNALCCIPKGTTVHNYGYYNTSNGTKWLYITVTLDGVEYIGFSSISYLKAK